MAEQETARQLIAEATQKLSAAIQGTAKTIKKYGTKINIEVVSKYYYRIWVIVNERTNYR